MMTRRLFLFAIGSLAAHARLSEASQARGAAAAHMAINWAGGNLTERLKVFQLPEIQYKIAQAPREGKVWWSAEFEQSDSAGTTSTKRLNGKAAAGIPIAGTSGTISLLSTKAEDGTAIQGMIDAWTFLVGLKGEATLKIAFYSSPVQGSGANGETPQPISNWLSAPVTLI